MASKRPDPKVLAPRIVQAVEALQDAQNRLSTVLNEVRRSCRHEVVAQSPAHLDIGEVTRVCIRCRSWAKGAITRGGGFAPYISTSPLVDAVGREVVTVEYPNFQRLLVSWPENTQTPIERVS